MADQASKEGSSVLGGERAINEMLQYSQQSPVQQQQGGPPDQDKIVQWIIDLCDESKRENALLELSKRRESHPELAVWLWHSFGTVAALLQETVKTYIYLEPPVLTAHQSNRVCNALALLTCIASHKETRKHFLDARLPMYLYPFLAGQANSRPFEYLRLTSLGVIGALVKTEDPDVIPYLLKGENNEIVPLCLQIMKNGTELSKTVAVFILQKVLWDDHGLTYICQTQDRFVHVSSILNHMINSMDVDPTKNNQTHHRLLRHILRCYLRFSEHKNAREMLRRIIPEKLKDNSFAHILKEDQLAVMWLAQINANCHGNPKNIINNYMETSIHPKNNHSSNSNISQQQHPSTPPILQQSRHMTPQMPPMPPQQQYLSQQSQQFNPRQSPFNQQQQQPPQQQQPGPQQQAPHPFRNDYNQYKFN